MTETDDATTAAATADAPARPLTHAELEALGGSTGRRLPRREIGFGMLFLLPALVVLGAWIVYPVFATIVRSLYDRSGDDFLGIDNYTEMFTNDATFTAIRNNIVWVIVAPIVVTAIGLVFAVLTERIRVAAAFKLVIFMPMAISFLASGVIFRLVYEDDPDRGLLNAMTAGVVEVFRPPGPYPGATAADPEALEPIDDGEAFVAAAATEAGGTTSLALLGIPPDEVPDDAAPAAAPTAGAADEITGVVWLDFTRGGGGERGVIDPSEVGLPGVAVQALGPGGDVVASAETDDTGAFTLSGLDPGGYRLRLPESTFREPFGGFEFLGPTLVTPAVIGAFIWIWAGFAMVVIAAGLSSIPREVLDAARVDGANEWQVFRRVTVPLLMPVLLVVIVYLSINVLKIFDLVLVIPPGSVQDDANVIALEMWRVSFGGARDQGLGSALAVLLFVLVLPAMAFNIRRFRAEND